ncbi:hypothetical protein RYA05_01050 [Pseudomonas syringae pv. actinidiae]|nr:hypothetical protein [Pseudomonas syringae pv. actinidiae]
MNFPEKADTTFIGRTGVVRMDVNVSPASKIADLGCSYFSHYDEDDTEPTKCYPCVIEFYNWLQAQRKVSTEKVIAEAENLLNKPYTRWVFSKDNHDEGIIVLCSENPETYLESLVARHTGEDPKDETTGAFLTNAVGLDFLFWLQKQVPAVMSENVRLAQEAATAALPVKDIPTMFVASSGEYPERIFFTWEDAVKSEIAYLDSFNEDGIKIASHKINENGEYTTDF